MMVNALEITNAPTVGPGVCCLPWPHHYRYICNKPVPSHLSLTLTAKCVNITSLSHHSCLPWSLATGPGGTTEEQATFAASVDHPQFSQRTQSCQCFHTQWYPRWYTITLPGPRATAQPQAFTTQLRVTAHSSIPQVAGECCFSMGEFCSNFWKEIILKITKNWRY